MVAPRSMLLVGRHVAVAQILPGAEPLAGAGEQHGADRGLALHAVERRLQRRMHRLVEAVELVRAVEGHRQDRAVQRRPEGARPSSLLPVVHVAGNYPSDRSEKQLDTVVAADRSGSRRGWRMLVCGKWHRIQRFREDRSVRERPTTVAVVGSGTMGAGIAQVAAAAGQQVLLHDARAGAAEQAIGTDRHVAAPGGSPRASCPPPSVRRSSAGCRPSPTLQDLAGAGLVVEAVVEDLAVKRSLFADLEAVVAPDAILATNTSSLSVTAIAAGLRRPERVVGMHFFNPVPAMALVEVVSGAATAPEVADDGRRPRATAWGKTPVHAQIDARLHRQPGRAARSTPRRCACWARAAATSRRWTR